MKRITDEIASCAVEAYLMNGGNRRAAGKAAGISPRSVTECVRKFRADGRIHAIQARINDQRASRARQIGDNISERRDVLLRALQIASAAVDADGALDPRDLQATTRSIVDLVGMLAKLDAAESSIAGVALTEDEVSAFGEWITERRSHPEGRTNEQLVAEMDRLIRDPDIAKLFGRTLCPGVLDTIEAATDDAVLSALANGERGRAVRERLAALLQKDTIARLQATAETFVAGVERDLHVETPGTA